MFPLAECYYLQQSDPKRRTTRFFQLPRAESCSGYGQMGWRIHQGKIEVFALDFYNLTLEKLKYVSRVS